MKSVLVLTAGLVAAVHSAGLLDIPALLASLGPAADTDPRWAAWKPPGRDDVRSPCPGLNSLANHGFINRNGKKNTIPQLISGGAAGLGMGADFMSLIGGLGLLSSPNPLGGSFDLDELDQHNFPIEHDASLSRLDAYFGNDYSYNDAAFQKILAFYNGLENTTTQTASNARYSRVQSTLMNNPEALYGVKEFVFSSAETGLYVQTMSSPLENSAPVDFVRSLFIDQRLPFHLGWRPSAVPVTLPSLLAYAVELYAVNEDAAGETFAFTQDSLGDVLVLLAGGSEVLSNLTSGITGFLGL